MSDRLRCFQQCFVYLLNPGKYSREAWQERFGFTPEELTELDRYQLILEDEAWQFSRFRFTEKQRKKGRSSKPPRRDQKLADKILELFSQNPEKSSKWVAIQMALKGEEVSETTVRRIKKSAT